MEDVVVKKMAAGHYFVHREVAGKTSEELFKSRNGVVIMKERDGYTISVPDGPFDDDVSRPTYDGAIKEALKYV